MFLIHSNKMTLISLRLSFTVSLFVLFSVFPWKADAKTDREVVGLIGSVQTVFEESSTWKEGDIIGGYIYRYDKEGRQIEFETGMYKACESINDDERGNKSISSYDPKTRETKRTFFRSDGSSTGKNVTSYTVGGEVKEHRIYNHDGSLGFKTVYSYDEQGKKVKSQSYKTGGTLVTDSIIEHKINKDGNRVEINIDKAPTKSGKQNGGKSVTTFDKKGNRLEMVSYNNDGSLKGRYSYTYNEKGMETGSFDYNADGSLDSKTTSIYEFDSVGNWIKKTSQTWESKEGKLEPSLPFITKRTIC